jgi:hypothetical protein
MVTSAEELHRQPLFGGMAKIERPSRFADVSDFRPVPDHQEVFSDASTDQSFIVEILVRFLGWCNLHMLPAVRLMLDQILKKA